MTIVTVKYDWFAICIRDILNLINGYFIYRLFVHYARPKAKRTYKILLFLTFAVSSGMIIWIGDHNLILTFPIYTAAALLCTEGGRRGRLSVIITFFCMEMPVCALIDTWMDIRKVRAHLSFHGAPALFVYAGMGRVLVFAAVFFLFRRKLPKEGIFLPERLWKVILRLSLLPLCALIAISFLTYGRYFSNIANTQAIYLCFTILPFIFLTSFAILTVISALADHEKLERAKQLSEMRETYYQNLRQHESSIRQMRHDMKNHLTTIRSLLGERNVEKAEAYLDALLGDIRTDTKARIRNDESAGICENKVGGICGDDTAGIRGNADGERLPESVFLQDVHRFCENEAANALLQSKAELLLQNGLDYDFRVHLEEGIAISDIDLCALLGNALDNAIRAAVPAKDKTITVRCRCDKGIFMLKVKNGFAGKVDPELKSTKADSERHGFGIAGMREIAARYGGALEVQIEGEKFTLMVYMESM